MKNKILIILLLLLLLHNSCDKFSSKNEGVIKYEVEYLEDPEEITIITLLPETMKLSFKETYTMAKMHGFVGSFGYVADNKKSTSSFFISTLFNGSLYYENNSNTFSFGYTELKDIEIELLEETKEILGFVCKKAIAHIPNSNMPKAEIYYTDEIKIENSTAYHPYKKLKGVPLEFEINMIGIRMRFTAKNIKYQKIADDDFTFLTKYEQVPKENITNLLNKFIQRKEKK